MSNGRGGTVDAESKSMKVSFKPQEIMMITRTGDWPLLTARLGFLYIPDEMARQHRMTLNITYKSKGNGHKPSIGNSLSASIKVILGTFL